MRKNRIRLTESQLHNVIKESVKRVLREDKKDYMNMAVQNCKARLKRQPAPFGRQALAKTL